ncbi:MAG: iron dicitrate ABC transporter ATP-binding protein [Gammaproteobacteria bacterium]|jgi:polysaccharide export outer membrane protein|nr:iron dicitrate ABC transporter ATP-binding protein [Gammaproteobacteria bacterium]
MHKTLITLAAASLLLAGCASNGGNQDTSLQAFQQEVASQDRTSEVNDTLMMKAVQGGGDRVYRVGAEDQIRVDIFGVPDLSREYRVNGAGRILMPLVGEVSVSGLSLSEVEQAIAEAYAEDYLRNPRVSVEVTEYRSQQFTVVGAVSNPKVYSVSRQTTIIEALAMAGGISDAAGSSVYLTDRVRDPDTGRLGTRTMIIDIEDLMHNTEEYNLVLGEAAMINIPRGGFVYVEGAVAKPGAYRQRSDTTVLKVLAEAGGFIFESDRSDVRVLRRSDDGSGWEERPIDYNAIRESPRNDIALRSGDIVVVDNSAIKTGLANFGKVFQPLAWLGFRPL